MKNYSWNTPDQVVMDPGETATLTFQKGGTYTIVLYADVNGGWQDPLSVSKTVTIGQPLSDRVFMFSNPEGTPDYIYFALRVKGTSPLGCFRQDVSATGSSGYAYARDLHTQVTEAVVSVQGQLTPYSNFKGEYIDKYSLNVGGYNSKTGFTNESGTVLDLPFYYGDDNYRVRNTGSTQNFTFLTFIMQDTTKDSILPGLGHPSFVSMIGSNKLAIPVPTAGFDSQRHRNIALFTVNFENYQGTGLEQPTVTFDGFVEK